VECVGTNRLQTTGLLVAFFTEDEYIHLFNACNIIVAVMQQVSAFC